MQIKRFEAVDMQEALRLVKGELGPDAVILSTKQIKKDNGVFGMSAGRLSRLLLQETIRINSRRKSPLPDGMQDISKQTTS